MKAVGIDMMFLHRIVLLRVLGHQLRMSGGVEAETSRKAKLTRAFMSSWVGRYGTPKLLVVDQGRENWPALRLASPPPTRSRRQAS